MSLVGALLRRSYPECRIHNLGLYDALDAAVTRGRWDLVVAGYRPGWQTGLEAARLIREVDTICPIIVLTSGPEPADPELRPKNVTAYLRTQSLFTSAFQDIVQAALLDPSRSRGAR
jgi:hypothetical protein